VLREEDHLPDFVSLGPDGAQAGIDPRMAGRRLLAASKARCHVVVERHQVALEPVELPLIVTHERLEDRMGVLVLQSDRQEVDDAHFEVSQVLSRNPQQHVVLLRLSDIGRQIIAPTVESKR